MNKITLRTAAIEKLDSVGTALGRLKRFESSSTCLKLCLRAVCVCLCVLTKGGNRGKRARILRRYYCYVW